MPPIPLKIFTDSNGTHPLPPTTTASICDELMLKQMQIKDEKRLKACVTSHCLQIFGSVFGGEFSGLGNKREMQVQLM